MGIVIHNDTFQFRYHHVNRSNEIKGASGTSVPHFNSEGKIELHEEWQWLDHDQTKGKSITREV